MALKPEFSEDGSSNITDTALIDGIKAKQVKALDSLYDHYGRLVFNVALRLLHNQEEAEDLTQDIFLQLWQNSEAYNPQRASLSSYLIVKTRSRAIDRLRSQKSKQRISQLWQASIDLDYEGESALNQLSLQEQTQQIQSALNQLSTSEREVLEIAYYKGLSQSQIAKETKLPLGTVKSRSRQALKKLRHALRPIL